MAQVYAKNSAEANAAKSFLHDLTYVAGLRSTNQRTNGPIALNTTSDSEAAVIVCDEVLNRSFKDVDSAIKHLAGSTVLDHLTKTKSRYHVYGAADIAEALVYLADCLNLHWDDLSKTTYEVDAFKKTILGKAVEKFGRFTSVLKATQATAVVQTQAPTNTSRRSGGGSQQQSQPKNGYKQSGPQSGNVRDLIGTPGVKLRPNGSEVYRIIGSNSSSKNIPTAFIRPLSPSGAFGSTNKVYINSGNGYTDLTCWFDDLGKAKKFLSDILDNRVLPSSITNLQVVKSKPDPNGYFLVGTEFGDCAVRARQLNEALVEQVTMAEDLDNSEEDNGWERVGQRMTHEDFDTLVQNMLK